MFSFKKLHKKIIIILFTVFSAVLGLTKENCWAASSFSISPMYQMMSLNPGERQYGNSKLLTLVQIIVISPMSYMWRRLE